MTRCHALLAALCLGLAACDTSDDGKLPVSLFECDAGEAAIRHLISKLPDLNPGIAKSYSIVLGEINRDGMTPATDVFTARFADLKLKFVNAMNLKVVEPDATTADPDTRLAAFVLQLRTLQQTSATTWQADVAWSYKKQFERLRLQLETKDGKTSVTNTEKLEGN
ncbi:MAG: hypothetical protein U1F71_04720 [Verrucomicrobiaceae bacterium]